MPQATVILGERYELGPVLGSGGMARVHRGKDRKLRRPVAVKVLAPPFDRDEVFVERFRREAHAAARLNHPNIVAVYDSGSDGDRHFIVTELVDGETLADLVAREGALPPERAVEIAVQVCHGLQAAHGRGVVHRDVKPGNVMLAPDGRVKVVDFGIARAAGTESVTRTGLVMGSASYLSPEQARGEPGDERSDVYALGCVLYQLLTGRPPFVAETPVAALYQHVNEPVAPPSSLRPVPEDLERVVLRALEKDPGDRYGSARELEDALAAAIRTEDGATMPLPVAGTDPTAPLPRVTAAAAAVAAADAAGPASAAPTEQVRRVERSPVGLVETPRPSGDRPRRRPRREGRPFPWAIVGAVVLGILVLAAIAMALGSADPREAARQAARDANRQESPSPSEESSNVVEPLTVEEAHAALVLSITEAEGGGGLEPDAAEELREQADAVLDAHRSGDAKDLTKEIEDFGEKLGEATGNQEITVETADRIRAGFNDLVVAIDANPIVEEPDRGGGGGGDDGDGEGD